MLFRSYTEKKTGMEIVDLGNGQWQDEDGVARAAPGAPALKPFRPAKAPDAPKKAKSPIKAAFKKTATFKRINSVIGHDETLSAAILRFNEEDRYADVLTLSNEDMIAFAAATAKHRAINTNDPQWHVVKAEIITRFGFRL